MKKFLIGALTAGAVASVALLATNAFFSDTETSTGNTFTAGKLDLIVDIDGVDQNPLNGPIFNVADFKPGDKGEKTISLWVDNNPSCGLASVNITNDTGLLNDETQFVIYKDPDCDNDREVEGGDILVQGTLTEGVSYAIGELPNTREAKQCYGVAYCFGTPGWTVDPQNQEQYLLTCNGAAIGNEAQESSFTGDITFTAAQKRNLYGEVCPIGEVKTLDLENKNDDWQVIEDNTYGTMTYSSDSDSFYGAVYAYNIEPNAKYQISLNGSGSCGSTDTLLVSAGSNLFQSGYWNNWAPGLSPTCTGNPGEGIYNMNLVSDWYTVISDNNGNFVYPFNINLPSGTYTDVKVLVKKVLDPFVAPWVDSSVEHTTNLFETHKINFVVN